MHSVDPPGSDSNNNNCNKKKKIKRELSLLPTTMPGTDNGQSQEDCFPFPVEDIVQYPLPGYVAPTSISFSPDDKLISYLFSSDNTLSRKIFAFDPEIQKQQMLVSPPGGGFDESNLSTAEKLRRERLRERGLGVTRYEWTKCSHTHRLMVPLPAGIYFQDIPGSELHLRLPSTSWSPIIDPQLSPDGHMIAFVRDDEIYVMPVTYGDPKQITSGARGNGKVNSCMHWRKLASRYFGNYFKSRRPLHYHLCLRQLANVQTYLSSMSREYWQSQSLAQSFQLLLPVLAG